MSATVPISFDIPCGTCTSCGRTIKEGEEARVILRAGSAWKDGFAVLEPDAELYAATVECPECALLVDARDKETP